MNKRPAANMSLAHSTATSHHQVAKVVHVRRSWRVFYIGHTGSIRGQPRSEGDEWKLFPVNWSSQIRPLRPPLALGRPE